MTRRRVIVLLLWAIVPLVVGAAIAGVSIWYNSTNYVTATSARVSGDAVQLAAPAAGNVATLDSAVGDTVQQGDIVGWLDVTPNGGAIANSVRAPLRAPMSGTIIRRYVFPGDYVGVGAPIFQLVNMDSLYVLATVDEDKVPLLTPGEAATVYLQALDTNVQGEVESMTPATADLVTTATAGQTQNASGVPQVPVMVGFAYNGLNVFPGMSAQVTIRVR